MLLTATGLEFLHRTLKYTLRAQPNTFGVLVELDLQSQSHWSLFNRTWQKRPKNLDHQLRFEIETKTLQMQQAVHMCTYIVSYMLYTLCGVCVNT